MGAVRGWSLKRLAHGWLGIARRRLPVLVEAVGCLGGDVTLCGTPVAWAPIWWSMQQHCCVAEGKPHLMARCGCCTEIDGIETLSRFLSTNEKNLIKSFANIKLIT